jgi:UDP-2,3-diacylglucosamine pyrophosphatase LpxH
MHILVSDLHLGQGDGLDDFLLGYDGNNATVPECIRKMDEKFGAFLKQIGGLAEQGGPTKLVLLGDVFDLIQVTGHEGPAKLDAIQKAHPKFFEDLRAFADNHETYYVVGNHDAEMLNSTMTAQLKQMVPGLKMDNRGLPLLYYQEGQLYCEHGNQLEGPPSHNVIDEIYRDFVAKPFTPADYPGGSRFVLTFVNDLESKYPDVDNIMGDRRAATAYYVISTKASTVFQGLMQQLRKSGKGVRGASVGIGDEALDLYGLLTGRPPDSEELQKDPVARELHKKLQEYVGTGQGIKTAGNSKAAAGAYELLSQNIAWLGKQKEIWAAEVDGNAARFVHNPGVTSGLLQQPDPGVRFIVCGHTHRAKTVASTDGQRTYLNSGTWRHFYDPNTSEYTQKLHYVQVVGSKAELKEF